MILDFHPQIRIEKQVFGNERATLLVIDNFVAEPDRLVKKATTAQFASGGRFYPGIRAKAPPSYEHFLATRLQPLLAEHFGFTGGTLRLSMCHYSLVTTPAAELAPMQRIPHVDSLAREGFATIHYLFKGSLGGTAFYRHRATGYESLDEVRGPEYFKALQAESAGPDGPGLHYINGDTPLFERIAQAEGVFNRMLVYRRNSLHSGSIDGSFVPDADPRTGRLSINSFIDPG
ncbi:hypothetical protein GCM10011487_61040 [Steroidobacter agaridevorans]|uniref:Uncharacterized protein n=1 Tax=Steroidobacter agaridevorans TaxID=2695856 RepID=A0A829YKZ9_9GAMM|nr:DUF6445 family protein [Steroidobacter agaridevorans]GFE84104.1 hypothetical protein GCM10011487_61040 [Steroidobacter agaridevorans]GFE86926.1 hypothetical protein GCM10011488_18800 [Steroidobacter agaridevorans]